MALSLMYWCKYVESFQKLARKSENAVNANRVLKFVYDTELHYVNGNVQASMRDRTYKVEVSLRDLPTSRVYRQKRRYTACCACDD